MALTAKNWPAKGITASTWTDLVTATAEPIIKGLTVSTGSAAVNVQLRIADSGGTSLGLIVPMTIINPTVGYSFGLPTLCLNSGEKLQVWADQSGCDFFAFGAE